MSRVAFRIQELTCPLDALALERRLRQVAGVDAVSVNPANDTAYVTFDPDQLDPVAIGRLIEAAGYRVYRVQSEVLAR